MKSVAHPNELAVKRFQKFHSQLRGFCSSAKHFDKYVEVDRGHITRQGVAKNNQRLSLSNEDIAAVIQQGALNLSLCQDSQGRWPVEIAIEGKISDFEWTDYSKFERRKEEFVQIRVAVRDRKPRTLVITAYILNPPEDRDFPEVKREIW